MHILDVILEHFLESMCIFEKMVDNICQKKWHPLTEFYKTQQFRLIIKY
jgi:hypothetical protein